MGACNDHPAAPVSSHSTAAVRHGYALVTVTLNVPLPISEATALAL